MSAGRYDRMGVWRSDGISDTERYGSLYLVKKRHNSVNDYGGNEADAGKLSEITNCEAGSRCVFDDTGRQMRKTLSGWVEFGGGSAPVPGEDRVRFLDYDGTVVAEFGKSYFKTLTRLPVAPRHEGLISEGWNYTFDEAFDYLMQNGSLDIGAQYRTEDGATKIYIKLEDGRLNPCLSIGLNGTATVNWGDETNADTMTGEDIETLSSVEHTYSQAGEYVISVSVEGTAAIFSPGYVCHLLAKNGSATADGDKAYVDAIQKIYISESVINIGNAAFGGCCNLKSITIPKSVTNIGDYAFSNCQSLLNIVIPDSVKNVGISILNACYNLASVVFPCEATIGRSTTFNNCYSLKSVSIPSSVKNIGSNTFSYCSSLVSVVIPNSVTSIGDFAFQNCYSLESLSIPLSVASIGNKVFQNCCSLATATIADSVETIGEYIFQNCYCLANITLSESLTSIKNYAFQNCYSLSNVIVPNSVKTIGNYAFERCFSLKNVTIPDSVTSIGNNAFANCLSLESMTMPNFVTSIGTSAFEHCNTLMNIIIPNSITAISGYSFYNLLSLVSITIPDSVTSIGSSAFSDCYALGKIVFLGTMPPNIANANAFDRIPTDCTIYVPAGSLSAYTSAANYPDPNIYTYVEYSE